MAVSERRSCGSHRVRLVGLFSPNRDAAAISNGSGVKGATTSKADQELRVSDVTPWVLTPDLVPRRKYNLLDREPQLWMWAEYDQAHYEFNDRQQEVLVDNPVFTLVSLGETSAADFQLEVEFSRSTQNGLSGLFFGAHPIKDREKWWHAYGVVLQRVTMDVTTEHRINIERYEISFEDETPKAKVRAGILSQPVVFREGIGHRLELFSEKGLLKSVRWNSQELDSLNRQPLTNDVFHS